MPPSRSATGDARDVQTVFDDSPVQKGCDGFHYCWFRFRRALSDRHAMGLATQGLPPGSVSRRPLLLRKEVIQPQVPLRLPCYDFIPITTHTLDAYVPCGFKRRLWVQTAFMM
jgi:hypothetical protein